MDAVALLVRTIKEILQTKRELQMPDWLEETAFASGTPSLHPTFINLTSTSWLARTIMLSDVALKSIVAIGPVAEKQLKAIVPGYISEGEFLRAHGYLDDPGGPWGRAYIAPGAFEISEAPGGDALMFSKTPMAIHLVKMSVDAAGVARDVPNAALTLYSGTLSAAYDQFAIQFPTLYKLREAAKIVAIARWLQKRRIAVSLPQGEALTWTPPRSIPTIMRPYLKVGDGGISPVAYVVGGVDLAPDQNWKITNAPAAAPGGDTDAAVPAASAASATQADLERRIAGASDPVVKSGLQLDLAGALLDRGDRQGAAIAIDSAIRSNPQNSMLLILSAQAHFDAGDAAGAAQIMSKYLKADPDNAPAQRMLAHFQQQPAQPAPNPTSKSGTITPFEWAGPVSRAYYSSDEHAPELTDIPIAWPKRPAQVPPPPAVLDAIQLTPEVADFNQKRADLIRQYHEAPPSETPAIVAKIAAGDAAFAKKAAGLEAAFGAAPQTGPAPVKPEEPKPDKKHKKAVLQ
jgi:tetratricopeptide (TPR) repeat protein